MTIDTMTALVHAWVALDIAEDHHLRDLDAQGSSSAEDPIQLSSRLTKALISEVLEMQTTPSQRAQIRGDVITHLMIGRLKHQEAIDALNAIDFGP